MVQKIKSCLLGNAGFSVVGVWLRYVLNVSCIYTNFDGRAADFTQCCF